MPSVCSSCTKPVEGKFLVCPSCKASFRLGKNCSALTDTAYIKISNVKREERACQACKFSMGSGDSDGSLVPHFFTVNTTLDQLTALEMLVSKVEDLLSFKETCEKLADTVTEIETSIDLLS